MTSRVAAVLLVFQGISLAALVFLGVVVFRLKDDVDSRESRPMVVPVAGLASQPNRSADAGMDESRRSSQHVDAKADLTRRMEAIEQKLADLMARMAESPGGDLSRRSGPADAVDPLSPEDYAELVARVDLEGRFAGEDGTSSWGEAATAAIEDASLTAYAENPFFAEHGGQVSTNCRETVCSLSWSPANSETLLLSNQEKAEILDRAKWELISLAGEADEGGQLRILMDAATSPPTIEILVDHDPGGKQGVPDRVSEYLETSGDTTKKTGGR